MSKKYELTDSTRKYEGKTLYRIRALRDFGNVRVGDIGGWVESEDNLSQTNNCWLYSGIVCDEAKISGNATVIGTEVRNHAQIYGNAFVIGSFVSEHAKIFGGEIMHATISDYAEIYDHAKIIGLIDAEDMTIISGHAEIYENATINFSSVIGGKAKIHGDAQVFGIVCGHAEISGNARFMGEATNGNIISTNYVYA